MYANTTRTNFYPYLMKKVKFSLPSSVMINMPQGLQVEAIQDGNTFYVPFFTAPASAVGDAQDTDTEAAPPAVKKAPGKKAVAAPAPPPVKPGKKSVAKPEPEPEEEEEGVEMSVETIGDVLEAFDSSADADAALEQLVAMGMSEEVGLALLTHFSENSDLDINDAAEAGLDWHENGLPEEEPAPKKKGKPAAKPAPAAKTPPPAAKGKAAAAKPGKKASKTKIEDFNDLEVNDKVSVYWESLEEHLTGTVTAIDDNGVEVTYDVDGESEYLDEAENTEVFRL